MGMQSPKKKHRAGFYPNLNLQRADHNRDCPLTPRSASKLRF